jgi:hypothetical protein
MQAARHFVIAVMVWTVVAPGTRAAAQTSTATLSATIGTLARLTLSATSVSFPNADPDTVPQVPAAGGPLLITAKSRATPGAQVLLTVLATDDLRSGISVLPISNITWTATGSGFAAGTMSKVAAATVAAWTGSGVRSGSQQMYFRNVWTHPTGTYTASIVYTLSAP